MIRVSVDGVENPIKFNTFKGGEEFVESEQSFNRSNRVEVYAYIRSSTDLMRLFSLLKLIEESDVHYLYLTLPYFPYARQDRKMNDRQPNQSNMMAAILSMYECIKTIEVHDVHSTDSVKLLGNVRNRTLSELISDKITHRQSLKQFQFVSQADAIVAPDAGAASRAQGVADLFGLPIIQCRKVRATDGSIERVHIPSEDIKGKRLVLVDDIIDGGRTFVSLAKEMSEAASLSLLCTHGIFSYGKDELNKYFEVVDSIYDWTQF